MFRTASIVPGREGATVAKEMAMGAFGVHGVNKRRKYAPQQKYGGARRRR